LLFDLVPGVERIINDRFTLPGVLDRQADARIVNKKAVLPQGNRVMPQVFFSVEVRQQHSLQV